MIGRRTGYQPRIGVGGIVAIVAAALCVVGFVALAVIDVPPPMRPHEIAIPHERFAK